MPGTTRPDGVACWLNDCHSQLNRTRVRRLARPASLAALVRLVREAGLAGHAVSVCGSRHAMGGQQFGADTVTVDMRALNGVLGLDPQAGVVEVEAGITWSELLSFLEGTRPGHGPAAGANGWGIAQKQTGADELTLGGAVAANIHGRGLAMRPFIGDLESIVVIDARGELVTCSRSEAVAMVLVLGE